MDVQITKPETISNQGITKINAVLDSKQWVAIIDEDTNPIAVVFNIQSVIDQMTETQKNIVKAFFRAVAAAAVNARNASIGVVVDVNDISGDIDLS